MTPEDRGEGQGGTERVNMTPEDRGEGQVALKGLT